MKPTMVLTDEDVQRVRESLAKTLTPQHKIVIAPCLSEVFVNKIRFSILRRPTKEKWSTVGRGVVALVYNTDSLGQRIEICLTSLKTRAVVWKETVVADLTRIESPQPTFHTFNSTKNFHEKAGIRYENETVARLVLRALSVFSSQSKALRDTRSSSGHKGASRSHSFNVAPRPRHPRARAHESAFERCTVALSNIQIQQVFSAEGRPLAEPQTARMCGETASAQTTTAAQENDRRLVSISEGCEKTTADMSRVERPAKPLLPTNGPWAGVLVSVWFGAAQSQYSRKEI
ncbi:hypothetical protein OS493_008094 [Desmophyllum pertusum]|uniref:WH1 domain-containing protein n=1 Tax=Desmophyllum pertusum TaxID=174260 RepID=A0A9W9YF62_9CNID|nr:hypothetical protein OS493_008094 [Desmophyllum pertusum]